MKRRTGSAHCNYCGRPVVRVNPNSVNYVLAIIPSGLWSFILDSPSLRLRVTAAVYENNVRELRGIIGDAAMSFSARRA